MIKLKLESSTSSPVATSIEVSMPHQPATFPFPSVSLANPSQQCIRFRMVVFVHGVASLQYREVADSTSNSTFCFVYICAMQKMPLRNADTAIVSNCDHDYLYAKYLKYCVVAYSIVYKRASYIVSVWN